MPPSSILTKAMSLLDLIAASPLPLSLTDIVDKSELPKSSCHRLLVLLREAHTLTYNVASQTYAPGPRLMRWGVQTAQKENLASIAAPHMRSLCQSTKARVALSVLDGDAVLFVHTIENGAPYRLAPRVGQHSPLHASAAGKLFMANMDPDAQADLLAGCDFEQCTEFTITSPQALLPELEIAEKNGFAVSAREEFRQISGLAVPIIGANNEIMAALSIWDVGDDTVLSSLQSQLAVLTRAASDIQVALGYVA